MYIIHIKPWADRSRQVVFGDNWGRPARHQLRSHHLPPSTCGSGGAVTHTPVIPLLHHKRSRQLVFSCIAIVLGHKRRSLELSSPTILLLHQVVQSQTKNIPVGADCTREGTMVMRTQVTSRGERTRVAISKPATDLGSAEKRKERGRLKRNLVQAIKVYHLSYHLILWPRKAISLIWLASFSFYLHILYNSTRHDIVFPLCNPLNQFQLYTIFQVDQCAFCEFKAKSRLLLVMHLRWEYFFGNLPFPPLHRSSDSTFVKKKRYLSPLQMCLRFDHNDLKDQLEE